MTSKFALFILMLATPGASAAGGSYYVATSGNDANPGTLAAPWKTLQKAANSATPGSTVFVRAGEYREAVVINVSGTQVDGPIVFRNYAGEVAVVDGTGLTVPGTDTGLFLIRNRNWITIEGFEIRNYSTSTQGRVPTGIHVNGACDRVSLIGNTIHHIANTYTGSVPVNGRDAHGIAVYGTASTPVSNLIVRGNTLRNLTLGSSEALVLNGNVDGFVVEGNTVHDCDNIGIDLIGHEGTGPLGQDQARNGVVRDNTVYGINTFGNPSYGNERNAGGVYVDGGRDILVERNRIKECNIGIEIASEHRGKSTSGITVRDNLIYRNHIGGIFIGGYDTARGSTENCRFTNNTLYQNDTVQDGNGEFTVQYDTRNNVITHNILQCNAQNVFISNSFTANTGNTLDYNFYFGPGGAGGGEFAWKNVTYNSFSAYRTATGLDAHSRFADPLWASADPASSGDFKVSSASTVIDAGDSLFTPAAGETDFGGLSRKTGSAVDPGAHEWSSGTPPPALPTVTLSASDATASEPGADTGIFTFTRTGATTAALTVNYTVSGTATSGSDYTAIGTSVVIPAGSATAAKGVSPVDDAAIESNETVVVTISTNAAYTVGSPSAATVTIQDNDVAVLPAVTVTATDATASEPGTNTGAFTFTRTGATTAALTVNYSVSGTAASGSDYASIGSSVVIPAGSASVAKAVTPIDDTVSESDETVVVTLGANAAYTVGSPNAATVTLQDNDAPALPVVTVTATDAVASETGGNSGTLTLTRSGPTIAALTVNLTIGGTASSGVDYAALGTSVTIPAGSATAARIVTPINDTAVEGTETVILTISSNAAYTVGSPSSATVSIQDDDTPAVGTGTGLHAEYHNDASFATVALTRLDPQVSFNWAASSPDPLIGPDSFSVLWLGRVQAQYDEVYTFYVRSSDGCRLWVRGRPVVDHWVDQATAEVSGQLLMKAGQKSDLWLEYYENTGDAVCELRWSSASTPKQIIPTSQLYPTFDLRDNEPDGEVNHRDPDDDNDGIDDEDDSDRDGDGIDNDTEIALGTDPDDRTSPSGGGGAGGGGSAGGGGGGSGGGGGCGALGIEILVVAFLRRLRRAA